MIRSLWCILFCVLAACSFQRAEAQTSILFCGGIENELPMGVSDRFYPDSAGAYLYAYYGSQSVLNTKQLGFEVYKKNVDKFELVGKKQFYRVKPKWRSTYIRYHFTSPGMYNVKLYDANQQLLAEGTVIIM